MRRLYLSDIDEDEGDRVGVLLLSGLLLSLSCDYATTRTMAATRMRVCDRVDFQVRRRDQVGV